MSSQIYNYIKWSFTSNVLLSTEYALATHSILHAINTDSETMRTLNYVGKDIIGQMGGLMYMSKMGVKQRTCKISILTELNK